MSNFLEEITPANHYKDDPVPTPSAFQDPNVAYCSHDLKKGFCRHKECPHYAPKQLTADKEQADE